MEISGFTATSPGLKGSTPPSLIGALGPVLAGGLNRFIDLSISEKFGVAPSTQADVLSDDPSADESQPSRPMTAAGLFSSPIVVAGLLTAAGVFLLTR